MKIIFQGLEKATTAQTVAGFLAEEKINTQGVVLELNGEIHRPGQNLEELKLHEGAALNLFRIVAGG